MKLSSLIKEAINEDLGKSGDITSNCLLKKRNIQTFILISNENAVISGLEVFKQVFLTLNKNIKLISRFKDGDYIKKGEKIVTLKGDAICILTGERTAINFLSHLSGVATETRKLVSLLGTSKTNLLDTRKTTPLYRELEKKAVTDGGGMNHRLNLSELIMIKDNHINSVGSIQSAIRLARAQYKRRKLIEVEVENEDQLNEAIKESPDIIMFDNWDIKDLKEAIKKVPNKIKTEISGQINPKTIKAYAKLGADYISTSYMFKNSKWIDFSLEHLW